MEPAGWATVAASLVAMFGAIAVALIQRQRAKPKQQWNGVERRTMEKIADDKVERHYYACTRMAEVQAELHTFSDAVSKRFDQMNQTIDTKLEAIRRFIIDMHGKP